MKKIVLFDFDGTIADTLQFAVKISNEYLKNEGYSSISKAELNDLRNMNPLQLITHLKFPIWKVPSLVKTVRENLYKEAEKIKIFPGVKKLIQDLKAHGFKLAILTSNLKETVDKFLAHQKLEVFDYIKCEPNILEKAKLIKSFLNQHSLKTKDVIYIGDEVRDIEACRSVGVQIVSVTWGFNDGDSLRKLKPDFIVTKPAQILEILKKI